MDEMDFQMKEKRRLLKQKQPKDAAEEVKVEAKEVK